MALVYFLGVAVVFPYDGQDLPRFFPGQAVQLVQWIVPGILSSSKKRGMRSSQPPFLVSFVDVGQQVNEPVGGPGSAGRVQGLFVLVPVVGVPDDVAGHAGEVADGLAEPVDFSRFAPEAHDSVRFFRICSTCIA